MSKKYRCNIGFLTVVEIAFGLYYTFITTYAWNLGIYGVIPFLMLFMWGYLYTGIWALAQNLRFASFGDLFARLNPLMRLRLRMTNFQ